MSRKILPLSIALFLACSLLLVRAPALLAQEGMTGTPQAGTNSSRDLAERDLAGALLSDLRAETRLSKLALKNSSDEQVKKTARQVISENNKLDAQLVTMISADSQVNTDVYNFGHPTSESREAERKVRRLKGAEFDKAYAREMDQYRQNEQKLIQQNSALLSSSRMGGLTARIQANSDKATKQLRQAAG